MEAVATLASGVAHNLRNVLQAVLTFIELARQEKVDRARAGSALDRAVVTTKKGAFLIEQLLTFARKQPGKLALRPVSPDRALREIEPLLRSLLGDQIQLQLDLGAANAAVMADPVQLEQILLNLVSNARDAMPEGGTIKIATRDARLDERLAAERGLAADRHVLLSVADDGEGMDAATKSHVFEPFFTTKDIGQGTGLGLSTTFALVKQFGGAITVDSARGQGTTFTIYLPSAAENA
jgi:signal transduction histidine kinase